MFLTPSQADDIRDFQIEGISIGDSLLDYFSIEEIKKEKYYEVEQKTDKEVAHFITDSNTGPYVTIKFSFKTNDKKYKILSISGTMYADTNKCKNKRNKIVKEIDSLFKNLEKRHDPKRKHDFDKSSYIDGIAFMWSETEFIRIQCYDWSKKSGYPDQLRVEVVSDELYQWLLKLHKKFY